MIIEVDADDLATLQDALERSKLVCKSEYGENT